MPKIHVTDMNGRSQTVEHSADGTTIMSILLGEGFDVGLCGGNCSCGTCCAEIEPEWLAKLQPVQREELALIHQGGGDASIKRLTCQVPFIDALDGIRLKLVPVE